MAELNFQVQDKPNEAEQTIANNNVDPSGNGLGGVVGLPNEGKGSDKKPRRPRRNKKVDASDDPNYKAAYAAYIEACRARKEAIAAAKKELDEARAGKKQAIAAWDVHIDERKLNHSKLMAEPAPVPPTKP